MKKATLILIVFLLSFSAKSQDLELLLLASDDASLLMENYISPVMNGMSSGLNNGWYHTAKTHKKGGFDITINANAAFVPENAKSFLFNANDYQYLSLESGSSTISTVMGNENNSVIGIRIPTEDNIKFAEFTMPNGAGDNLPINAVPSPMVQATVGIPFSTDITVRYLPKTNLEDVEGNLFGLGVKHNLMQYFGPLDKLPLNLAILGGFTNLKASYQLTANSNQEAVFTLNSYTIQAVASLDFPFISFYGGVGYEKGSASLNLNGTYELSYEIENSQTTVTETATDPLSLNFNTSGTSATIGARLNLFFLKIYGAYTVKEYNTLSAGIALSFR